LKGKKVGDAFGGGEEGGVANGFTRGGVGHGFAKERPARVVFPGKLDLNRGSGNTNEVFRVGVEDINLQKAVGMKNEFEVVSGDVFSNFHELTAMRSDMYMLPDGTTFVGVSPASEEEQV
jgi:hypothetical protein